MIEGDGDETVHVTGGFVLPKRFTVTNRGMTPIGPCVRAVDDRGRVWDLALAAPIEPTGWDAFYAFGRSPRRG